MKPQVVTKCVANIFSRPDERIIQVFDKASGIGCLISLLGTADKLNIHVYCQDDGVIVTSEDGDFDEQS